MTEARKVLIVVDLLKGFVTEGNLASGSIKKIIPEAIRLVEEFLQKEQAVIFVKDSHTPDSVEFNSFPQHCIKGTKEAEMVEELIKYESEVLIAEKNAISAMYSKEFMRHITNLKKIEECVIIGCESDMCVANLAMPLKSYYDQQNIKMDIIIPENAVATYHIENIHDQKDCQDMALSMMKNLGIKLVKKYEMEKK